MRQQPPPPSSDIVECDAPTCSCSEDVSLELVVPSDESQITLGGVGTRRRSSRLSDVFLKQEQQRRQEETKKVAEVEKKTERHLH